VVRASVGFVYAGVSVWGLCFGSLVLRRHCAPEPCFFPSARGRSLSRPFSPTRARPMTRHAARRQIRDARLCRIWADRLAHHLGFGVSAIGGRVRLLTDDDRLVSFEPSLRAATPLARRFLDMRDDVQGDARILVDTCRGLWARRLRRPAIRLSPARSERRHKSAPTSPRDRAPGRACCSWRKVSRPLRSVSEPPRASSRRRNSRSARSKT
jgi:hypothetical protein